MHKLCTEAGFVLREEAGFRALLGKEAKEEGKDHGCAKWPRRVPRTCGNLHAWVFACSLAPAAADLRSGIAGACTAAHCCSTITTSTAICTRSMATSAPSQRVSVLCLSTQLAFMRAQCAPPACQPALRHCRGMHRRALLFDNHDEHGDLHEKHGDKCACLCAALCRSKQLFFMHAQRAPPACRCVMAPCSALSNLVRPCAGSTTAGSWRMP
jgi:hypothetical protein